MSFTNQFVAAAMARSRCGITVSLALLVVVPAVRAEAPDVTGKLEGFDSYLEQTLKDWNTPGIGVGIVVNDKLDTIYEFVVENEQAKALKQRSPSGEYSFPRQ